MSTNEGDEVGYLSVPDLAENLGVKDSTLYQWIRNGQIPGVPTELRKARYKGRLQFVVTERQAKAAENFVLLRWLYIRNCVEKEDRINEMAKNLAEQVAAEAPSTFETLEAFQAVLEDALNFVKKAQGKATEIDE